MSQQSRVEALANRLDEATAAVVEVAASCSEAQWKTVVEEEDRSVGLLFHHLAYPTQMVVGWLFDLVAGGHLPKVSKEAGDDYNARHKDRYGLPFKEDTIALLLETNNRAVADLRTFTEDQLDIAVPFTLPYMSEGRPNTGLDTDGLIDGKYISVEMIVEWNLIGHRYHHLAQIKKALGIR